MALSILDGNQSATTLSTILTSGQHITAHTVVSLGTQAITDMRGAVSGSVVSISNFPASQIISGTVTANPTGTQTIAGTVTANVNSQIYGESTNKYAIRSAVAYTNGGDLVDVADTNPFPVTLVNSSGASFFGTSGNPLNISGTVTIGSALPAGANRIGVVTIGGGTVTIGAGTAQIGSVTVGNSVTIGSLPAISGTVTANAVLISPSYEQINAGIAGYIGDYGALPISGTVTIGSALPTGTNRIGVVTIGGGTVTIGAGTAQIGSVTVGNSVTIGSLPAISGTVTANTFALQGTAVTTSNFTSTTASTVLASYNATREVLTIFNEGAGNLHICAGATCTTIAYQVRLSAGDYYEVPNHQTSITHSAVFATAGTARVCQVS